MIRLATATDFPLNAVGETAVRINALFRAYGDAAPFLSLYADGCGGVLALFEGVGFLYTEPPVSEEWQMFLLSHPDIRTVHTDAPGIRKADLPGTFSRTGAVLRWESPRREFSPMGETPSPRRLYPLLKTCFEKFAPFDGWYVDTSHRLRHGLCHIRAISDGERVISSAMTLAESDAAVLFGAVATDPASRGDHLAFHCLSGLIEDCKGKELYICPRTPGIQAAYEKFGFSACGNWFEWNLQK